MRSVSWITSQNDTAPKHGARRPRSLLVGLPVRTTLLQNTSHVHTYESMLDYQSERHCSKTAVVEYACKTELDYQSERHCSKTVRTLCEKPSRWITSQNDTAPKLTEIDQAEGSSWITSQNDTAPKLKYAYAERGYCWITSQNDTAPKLDHEQGRGRHRWITSQNDTAPKRDT